MSVPSPPQERAQSEQELRIQRQIAFASGLFQGDVTVRTLLESVAEGVVIIDNSGTILLVNTRAEQMFGYPQKELIGMPHAVLIPERFRTIHEEHMAHFFAEPKIRPMGLLLDLTGCHQDGSEFPLEISLSFIETINGLLVMAFISDITLRKQHESHFREADELFRIQVEGVKDYAIFMLDTEGNVLNWNAGAERLKGYRAEEIIGKHFACFCPEGDRSAGKPEDELKKAITEGRSTDIGWRVRKDGSRFWADVIITALYDGSGNLRGFSKVIRDITERKIAEEALHESEVRYRTLFDAIDEGFCVIEMIFDENEKPIDYRFLEVNPSFEKQTGLANAQGKRISELVPKHEEHWFEIYGRVAVTGQPVRFQNLAEQLHRWYDVYAFRFSQPEKRQVAILFNDITTRKKTEDALRFSEARYRSLFQDNPTMIFTIDTNWTLLSANQFSLKQLGYTLGELEGQSILTIFHEDDRLTVIEQFGNCLQNPDQIYRWQFRKIRKDGELLWVEETAQAVNDLKGARNILVVCQDITERKQAEDEIKRLVLMLSERAADLEDINRELEAFNYTVAHDLRQPLNLISMYCQASKELCGDDLNEKCKSYLQGSYAEVQRMNQLIEALLNFSRLSHVDPQRETVDLYLLAQEIATMLKQTEPERQVYFRIADGIMANADGNLLRIVLANLLGNAWKYTEKRKEAVIEFSTQKIDGQPVYYVRDNGIGFDMTASNRLFTPFQRLPGAEECKGFGIGLATVERAIRRHGGKIWAEAEPDKGATFYFTLAADGEGT